MRHLRNVLEPLALGAGRLTRDELLMVVGRIAADQSLWRPVVRHDPVRRWYGRLHTSPTLEVWLLGWVGGQDTRLHDHGGSSGAFSVVEGTLGEEYGYVESWTGGRRRTHAAGRMRSFGPGYVHNLGNEGTVQATSIHAYSPPLSTMTYYRPGDTAIVPYETVITCGPDEGIDVGQRRRRRLPRERGLVTVDEMLAAARARLERIGPRDCAAAMSDGALLVDIRPQAQRRLEGEVPGALLIERNVLEWRLDPTSPDRIPEVDGHDRRIVVMCSEGYTSSLAAASLQDLGLHRATDLEGGFNAWRAAGLPTCSTGS